jgi:hypothetical protein
MELHNRNASKTYSNGVQELAEGSAHPGDIDL